MRGVVFRVLAGLLAVAFGALLALGDTSTDSGEEAELVPSGPRDSPH